MTQYHTSFDWTSIDISSRSISDRFGTATGSHGLSVTPATKDFYITAYATEPIDMYVDTITSTQFSVRCAAVVTATRTIGWRVDTS
jgi:hypothetical protein